MPVILQWDRLPACQARRLEAGATVAAARRIPVFIPAQASISGFLAHARHARGNDRNMQPSGRACHYLVQDSIGRSLTARVGQFARVEFVHELRWRERTMLAHHRQAGTPVPLSFSFRSFTTINSLPRSSIARRRAVYNSTGNSGTGVPACRSRAKPGSRHP